MNETIDLDALDAAEKAMTPGPWTHYSRHRYIETSDASVIAYGERGDRARGAFCEIIWPGDVRQQAGWADPDLDAAGIVALRNAAPALIARLRKAEAECGRLALRYDGAVAVAYHYRRQHAVACTCEDCTAYDSLNRAAALATPEEAPR